MFKVGQEVFSAAHGEGLVTEVENMITTYPVLVKFNSGVEEIYTFDGRLFISDKQPDLVAIPYGEKTMFKVGQKVWCAMFGEGEVTRILTSNTQFPVKVKFGGLTDYYYNLDGKFQTNATQTLFPYPVEITKKVVKPSINWDHVAPKYKYFSEDSEGNAFLYGEEPYVATDASAWYAQSDEVVEALGFASYTKGTCHWKDSLVKRPEVQ